MRVSLPKRLQQCVNLRAAQASPAGLRSRHLEQPPHQNTSSGVKRHTRCFAAELDVSQRKGAETTDVAQESALPTGELDLRVGKIVSCEKHPDADSLYVESIDIGEDEPRTIVSGLVEYVAQEDLQDRKVVIIANLKARNMRGVKSHGMLLCASNKEAGQVEPLQPPDDAQVGERIFFEEQQPEPAKENRVQKKKLWEAVQPDLATNESCVATFKNVREMMTSAGPVRAASLANAGIS